MSLFAFTFYGLEIIFNATFSEEMKFTFSLVNYSFDLFGGKK